MEARDYTVGQLGVHSVLRLDGDPSETPMTEGAFLSEVAFDRLRQAFAALSNEQPESRKRKFETLLSKTRLGDEPSFDDYYYFLYLLRLGKRDEVHVKPVMDKGLSKLLALKAMLDMQIPEYRPGMSFDETLIDENIVADIVLFSKAVRRLVPYTTRIEGVGLGCVWLEFGVYGDRQGFSVERDLPFLSREMLEAPPERTSHPAWRAAKTRFRVAALELSPV